jgi:hypothetical protein
MGDHHSLDRPREDLGECGSRCTTFEEARAPITWRAGSRCNNSGEASNDAAPTLELVARKVLNQIGEQGRVAGAVKEHYLG